MRKEEIALELYNSAKENGILDTIYGNQSDCDWHWVTKPWPWEKEAN